MTSKSKSKKPIVPGWNAVVRDAHLLARDAFSLWQASGKPSDGYIAHAMRHSWALFKYMLCACKRMDDKHRADCMAKNLLRGGNRYDFWKSVKRSVNSKVPLRNTVNNISGSEKNIELWKDHYRDFFIVFLVTQSLICNHLNLTTLCWYIMMR